MKEETSPGKIAISKMYSFNFAALIIYARKAEWKWLSHSPLNRSDNERYRYLPIDRIAGEQRKL